jgi:Spy/CpxP family protein refolding chaperone
LYEPRTSREQAREDTLLKLQSVLTPQQLEEFKVLTERPGPGRGRRGPPPAQRAE